MLWTRRVVNQQGKKRQMQAPTSSTRGILEIVASYLRRILCLELFSIKNSCDVLSSPSSMSQALCCVPASCRSVVTTLIWYAAHAPQHALDLYYFVLPIICTSYSLQCSSSEFSAAGPIRVASLTVATSAKHLNPVFMIQPVAKPGQPVGQAVKCLFTRCTGCSTGLTTVCIV